MFFLSVHRAKPACTLLDDIALVHNVAAKDGNGYVHHIAVLGPLRARISTENPKQKLLKK